MFSLAKQLRAAGILGLNARNANYISLYNPRKFYPLVDDKLETKKLAASVSIKVPELYAVLEMAGQLSNLAEMLQDREDFVIKPAQGSGGEGVLVISGRTRKNFRTISGLQLSLEELQHHITNILGGMYSLGGHPDKALIEYRVRFDSTFEGIGYLGVPDIRIVVFLGVPVMAMVRLPTRMSDGKANLHQGAVGAGIDLNSGCTINAVWRNHIISEHPDSGANLHDIQIPGWQNLLNLAAGCFELTGLGLIGVDIVLDKEYGPMLLELNARPGLNIQIANGCGLEPRLKLVRQNREILGNKSEPVGFAMQNFGASQPALTPKNPQHYEANRSH